MAKLYASLTGPLTGLYYPLPTDDEIRGRLMLNSSKLKRLWCSVYTDDKVSELIMRWGGHRLPDSMAQSLDYDYYFVEEHMRNLDHLEDEL